jgi:hypothetical protein
MAKVHAQKALKMAIELNDVDLLIDIHQTLSDIYTAQKHYVEAPDRYKLRMAARDSLSNEANTRKTVQL